MKKSKILAVVMLLAMFSSVLTIVNINTPSASGYAPVTEDNSFESDWVPAPLGDKGILITDITAETITIDGDLSDWASVPYDYFGGVAVYLGFDGTDVYVAVEWADSSNDKVGSYWNKTGSMTWEHLNGADDMITVGFSFGVNQDLWVWTASNKTDQAHAYEMAANGTADIGTLPHTFNTVANTTGPLFDNSQVTIPDWTAIPDKTYINAWYPETAAGGQTDVTLASTWNATGDDTYVVEFMRSLDTGDADDIALDFSDVTGMQFCIGKANKDNAKDMLIGLTCYDLALTNDAPSLTFNTIVNPVTEALLITGTVYDDFLGWDLIVYLDTWDDTYGYQLGPGFYLEPDVNVATGNWSFLFFYDSYDMPLGDSKCYVEFYPKYDAPISIYQNVTIEDVTAPQVVGLVNIMDQYPTGVPNETESITITVGVQDNYADYNIELSDLFEGIYLPENLTVELYYYMDDGVALSTPMTQFSYPGGLTYNADIPLALADPLADNNYTYFVSAWDGSLNKATSVHYWFIVGDYTPPVTTPGFGLIMGLFGAAVAVFIIKKKLK